jgi:hypothetical protein
MGSCGEMDPAALMTDKHKKLGPSAKTTIKLLIWLVYILKDINL